jgi:hypothetical protein
MSVSSDLMPALPMVAGALAIVAVHRRKMGKQAHALPVVPVYARPSFEQYELFPAKWYHHVLAAGLLALPIVQWLAYDRLQSWAALVVPVALFVTLALPVVLFSPRSINREPMDVRRWLLALALLFAGTFASFLLPAAEEILVSRALLLDVTAIAFLSFVTRTHHLRNQATS